MRSRALPPLYPQRPRLGPQPKRQPQLARPRPQILAVAARSHHGFSAETSSTGASTEATASTGTYPTQVSQIFFGDIVSQRVPTRASQPQLPQPEPRPKRQPQPASSSVGGFFSVSAVLPPGLLSRNFLDRSLDGSNSLNRHLGFSGIVGSAFSHHGFSAATSSTGASTEATASTWRRLQWILSDSVFSHHGFSAGTSSTGASTEATASTARLVFSGVVGLSVLPPGFLGRDFLFRSLNGSNSLNRLRRPQRSPRSQRSPTTASQPRLPQPEPPPKQQPQPASVFSGFLSLSVLPPGLLSRDFLDRSLNEATASTRHLSSAESSGSAFSHQASQPRLPRPESQRKQQPQPASGLQRIPQSRRSPTRASQRYFLNRSLDRSNSLNWQLFLSGVVRLSVLPPGLLSRDFLDRSLDGSDSLNRHRRPQRIPRSQRSPTRASQPRLPPPESQRKQQPQPAVGLQRNPQSRRSPTRVSLR